MGDGPFTEVFVPPEEGGMVVIAMVLGESLAEFVDQIQFAGSCVHQLTDARLFVYWLDDAPFKGPLLGLSRHITYNWAARGRASLPLDAFDDANGKPVHVRDMAWFRHRCHRPNLVLTPAMMRTGWPDWFGAPALFLWEDRKGAELDRRLEVLGLRRDQWFCVVEVSRVNELYSPVSCSDTTTSDDSVMARLHKVVSDGGGQILWVSLGDFPARQVSWPGLELSNGVDNALLLARAIARARAFVEIFPTGMNRLARGSGTPEISLSAGDERAWGELEELCSSALLGRTWREPSCEANPVKVDRLTLPLRPIVQGAPDCS